MEMLLHSSKLFEALKISPWTSKNDSCITCAGYTYDVQYSGKHTIHNFVTAELNCQFWASLIQKNSPKYLQGKIHICDCIWLSHKFFLTGNTSVSEFVKISSGQIELFYCTLKKQMHLQIKTKGRCYNLKENNEDENESVVYSGLWLPGTRLG